MHIAYMINNARFTASVAFCSMQVQPLDLHPFCLLIKTKKINSSIKNKNNVIYCFFSFSTLSFEVRCHCNRFFFFYELPHKSKKKEDTIDFVYQTKRNVFFLLSVLPFNLQHTVTYTLIRVDVAAQIPVRNLHTHQLTQEKNSNRRYNTLP